jgi:hypothetical protein
MTFAGYKWKNASDIIGYGGLTYTSLEKMVLPGHDNYF